MMRSLFRVNLINKFRPIISKKFSRDAVIRSNHHENDKLLEILKRLEEQEKTIDDISTGLQFISVFLSTTISLIIACGNPFKKQIEYAQKMLEGEDIPPGNESDI